MNTVHASRAVNSTEVLKPVFNVLRITYAIIPVVAGLDKFTDLLVDWEKYLHPGLISLLPFSPHTFMMIVGVIEIVAGIIVFIRPAVGGYIVMAWLTLIAITLLAGGHFLDVAVRDLAMAIGALTLARISKLFPSPAV